LNYGHSIIDTRPIFAFIRYRAFFSRGKFTCIAEDYAFVTTYLAG
jgi:hypothetical protein